MMHYKTVLFIFLKYLAECFDILKIQDKRKVELFRPQNSYILHSHVECGSVTLSLIGNGMEIPLSWKY